MDWLSHLADAPLANVLFLAGLAFLAVGVLGKIAGKIEPDKVGRAASAVVGVVLVSLGLYLHVSGDHDKTQTTQANNVNGVAPSPTPGITQGRNESPNGNRQKAPRSNVSRPPSSATPDIRNHRNGPVEPVNFPGTDRQRPQPNYAGRGSVEQIPDSPGERSGPVGPPRPPRSPDLCKPGYVWREAFPYDHVCVTPATRQVIAMQNREAAIHRNPAGGPYGVDTCLQGYIWREAQPSDHVCVVPEARRRVAIDNAQAQFRRVQPN